MVERVGPERTGMVRRLQCHPDTPSRRVSAVDVEWLADDANEALLTFTVIDADMLVVPEPRSPERADALWRTTCFELFWRARGADAYVELNFSPSNRWAAYGFDGYRSAMQSHPMEIAPVIATWREGGRFVLEVDIDFSTLLGDAAAVGLSAVIEETDGTRSYWALAHPPQKPDFHHDACFALELPAAG